LDDKEIMFSNKCLFISIIIILFICGIVIFFQTYTLGLAYIDLSSMKEQIGEYENKIAGKFINIYIITKLFFCYNHVY